MTEGIESGRISRPSGAESHASEWDVIGYADRLSVRPDEVLRVMVSSSSPTFSARVFRLGGPEPIEAAIPGQGTYPGRGQTTRIGSYAQVDPKGLLDRLDGLTQHLWIWPTLPAAGRSQGLVPRWRNGEG